MMGLAGIKQAMRMAKLRARTAIIILLAIIGLVALAIPIRQLVLAQNASDANDRGRRLSRIIAHLDNLLSNPALSEDSRDSIELRRQYFEWQATQAAKPSPNSEQLVSQKRTLAAGATGQALYTTPLPTSSRPVGILKGPDTIRHLAREARISDIFWVGKIGGSYIVVYTGSIRNDPSQGVVYVFPENVGSWLKFLTPAKVGSIKVVNYRNNRLILASDQGDTLYFDVAARRFANTIDDLLTPAPLPTATTVPPYPGP
jgi:hypothetical protein